MSGRDRDRPPRDGLPPRDRPPRDGLPPRDRPLRDGLPPRDALPPRDRPPRDGLPPRDRRASSPSPSRTPFPDPRAAGSPPPHRVKKPPLSIQVTTLWEYPSQDYGDKPQGIPGFKGATPSYIIWNLLQRYTKPRDLVIDCFAGSGTTLDVARDLGRRALGYDVHPARTDIFRVDARHLPAELTAKVDFVFIDPPYSTHLDYGPDPRDIGKLDAATDAYHDAMDAVFAEIERVLKPGAFMGLYVSDSYVHGEAFHPIGFDLFARLRKHLAPVDIIAVTRHNKTLEMGNYRKAAEEGNFFLRGFNYLFIMRKPNKD